MATDLQDLARRLFKAAETMWTNTDRRLLPALDVVRADILAPGCKTGGRMACIIWTVR
jgi:hypothetical protein